MLSVSNKKKLDEENTEIIKIPIEGPVFNVDLETSTSEMVLKLNHSYIYGK